MLNFPTGFLRQACLCVRLVQVEGEPLLPIPVATEKRPDPRLALTIGVAGWIADSNDFGRGQPRLSLQPSACGHSLFFVRSPAG